MELLGRKENENSEHKLNTLDPSLLTFRGLTYLGYDTNSYPHHHPVYFVCSFDASEYPAKARICQSFRLSLIQWPPIAQCAHPRELFLSTRNVQELAVGGMEHGYAERKVDAHQPKLRVAREDREEGVYRQRHASVCVK